MKYLKLFEEFQFNESVTIDLSDEYALVNDATKNISFSKIDSSKFDEIKKAFYDKLKSFIPQIKSKDFSDFVEQIKNSTKETWSNLFGNLEEWSEDNNINFI